METLIRSPRLLDEHHTLRYGVRLVRPSRTESSGRPPAVLEPVPEPVATLPVAGAFDGITGEARDTVAAGEGADARATSEATDLLARELARLQTMREELETARKSAIEEGYQAGYEHGSSAALKEHGERLEQLRGLLQAVGGSVQEQIAGLEETVVDIAFESVCKIVGSAMTDRAGVVATVREIIAMVKERDKILIRVSPSDLRLLSESKSQLLAGNNGAGIEIVADDRVVLGGCLVETGTGSLDARLETQLQSLRECLLAARRSLPE